MADSHKPRHIRDIAHLYISRLPQRQVVESKNVFLVGTTRSCFPGYHAANIAVGLTKMDYSVRLLELSGLWPCCAHFLSLPPRVYLRRKRHQRNEELSALANVTLRFTVPNGINSKLARRGGSDRTRSRAGCVDLYHLPPVENLQTLSKCLKEVSAYAGPDARAVMLAANEAEAGEAWKLTGEMWGKLSRSTILLACAGAHHETLQLDGTRTRYISNWQKSLCDKVTCIVRAPDSYLSRIYLSICGELTSPPRIPRGKNAPRAASRFTAAGPIW